MGCGCASTVCNCEDVTLPTGEQGYNGWNPILTVIEDNVNLDDENNSRFIHQITGWTGGSGTTPTTFINYYIGVTGPVVDIANGVNIRGASGATPLPYTSYTFRLTQAASGNPIATDIYNNTGITISWVRNSAIQIVANMLILNSAPSISTVSVDNAFNVLLNSGSITLGSSNGGVLNDSIIVGVNFELRIYS